MTADNDTIAAESTSSEAISLLLKMQKGYLKPCLSRIQRAMVTQQIRSITMHNKDFYKCRVCGLLCNPPLFRAI